MRVSYTEGRQLIRAADRFLIAEQRVLDGAVTGWSVVERRAVARALGARP